jgi:hypothetical protein
MPNSAERTMPNNYEGDMRPVTFRGMLCGRGSETSPCTVSAMEVAIPGDPAVYYTAYSITSVLRELPEGHYKLLVNGETIPITRRNGAWEFRSQAEN